MGLAEVHLLGQRIAAPGGGDVLGAAELPPGRRAGLRGPALAGPGKGGGGGWLRVSKGHLRVCTEAKGNSFYSQVSSRAV